MLVRVATIALALFACPLTSRAQDSTTEPPSVLEGRFEIGFGVQYGHPLGDFDEVADFGFGGLARIGYWATERLSFGGSYIGYGFLPPDLFSNVEFYDMFDDVGWSINGGELDVRFQLISYPAAGGGTHSVYATAKVGWYRAKFTADLKPEFNTALRVPDTELSDDAAGYSGGLGYRFMGIRRSSTILKGLSLTLEVLYCHQDAKLTPDPFDMDFLVVQGGVSFHLGGPDRDQ